jgi:hypothetical protein
MHLESAEIGWGVADSAAFLQFYLSPSFLMSKHLHLYFSLPAVNLSSLSQAVDTKAGQ